MAGSKARLTPGDILEIDVPGGRGIIQYIGEHHELGGTIWVTPRVVPPGTGDPAELVAEDGYYTWFPARPAVQKGLARVIGRADLRGRALPTRTRRRGAIDASGWVLTWFVSDGSPERLVRELSAEQRRFPIEEIANLDALAYMITEGWRPEQTPGDRAAPAPAPGQEDPSGTTVHYLYFPTPDRAEAARRQIADLGFDAEVSRAALGPQWLVKATSHEGTVIGDAPSQTETLTDITRRIGGEYDGWERAV